MSTPRPNVATRVIQLDMGQVRDRERNTGTLIGGTDPLLLRERVPFEALFLAHYEEIRALVSLEARGAAVIAIHAPTARLAGRLWVTRKPDRPNAAVIGRHSECDLVLDRGGVSLRHVALIVPKVDAGAPRFWLRELRTHGGLDSEAGIPIGGALVERAGLFRLGGYALIAIATGTGEEWPASGVDAWAELHGRSTALRVVGMDAAKPASRPVREASVSVIRGPLETSMRMLDPGGEKVCTLRLESGPRRARLALDEAALGRGVLLGRYSRCDSSAVLADEGISRVHAMVVRVEDQIVLVDTGSTQGVYEAAQPGVRRRVVVLSDGEVATLGDDLATVRLA